MTETSQNLLESRILDFGTLLYPDDTDTIQGFQLCRLVHAFEDDAAAVTEAHLHRRRGKRDIVRHLHGFGHFHQKVIAGIPNGIEYLADHQGLAFLLQQLLNQLHGNMVALRTAITATVRYILWSQSWTKSKKWSFRENSTCLVSAILTSILFTRFLECYLDRLFFVLLNLGLQNCNPRLLLLTGQLPVFMQELIILFDKPLQRFLGSGLRLQEIALLIPSLLYLPALLCDRLPILMAYLSDGHILLVPHIHDGLRPDDCSISYLHLVP